MTRWMAIARWIAGAVIGTLLVAATSPWFVRSYLPRRLDPVRGVWTLPPGGDYRWRSEGYATTRIGPHGMPGRMLLPDAVSNGFRVALWGDSQAEGVCVPDRLKLFAQVERLAGNAMPLSVFPLARSGDHAAVWLSQMRPVEEAWSIDAHVILVVDLPDLKSAPAAPVGPEPISLGQQQLARYLPDFVIEAGRHLVTEPDGVTPRRLRFGLGPVAPVTLPRTAWEAERLAESSDEAESIMSAVAAATDRPVMILHAPPVPTILSGRVIAESPHAEDAAVLRQAAAEAGILWIDARERLLRSAAAGRFPHGFHNGQIGVGHLNAIGNRLLAEMIVEAIEGWRGVPVKAVSQSPLNASGRRGAG